MAVRFPVAVAGQKGEMEQVVETLNQAGVEAATVDEDGVVAVEVPCNGDCEELISQIDGLLREQGLPFVPVETDGKILIRPPAG